MASRTVQVAGTPQKGSGINLPSKRREVAECSLCPGCADGCTTEPRCLKGLGTAVPAWLWCLVWTNLWYCNWLWFLNKHLRCAVLQCVAHRPKNQKVFHCLGFYHYLSQWKQSRLLDMCFRIFFLLFFLFCFFVPKLKWKERESQVGMDTWHDIKHGILVLYL